MTIDIPGAFMQADMDELVHVRFDGIMAHMLIKCDPTKYDAMPTVERGKTVIYAALTKALYGTLRASLLFWRKLTAKLISWGYDINPYDWCVANKEIDGSQCTVVWHVDDLKVSHVSDEVLESQRKLLNDEFGREAPLTGTTGLVHDYLGMTLDYSVPGKVIITMSDYIEGMLSEAPPSLLGESATPAAAHLFNTEDDGEPLDDDRAAIYYHHTMQLLYLSKRARPDLQLPVSFLTTRVKNPTEHDWKKLARTMQYLQSTADLPLTLEASSLQVIKWYIDASYAVHADMQSHTGAFMTLGKAVCMAHRPARSSIPRVPQNPSWWRSAMSYLRCCGRVISWKSRGTTSTSPSYIRTTSALSC